MNVELRAYLWTLAALVLVFLGTLAMTAVYPHLSGKLEAFGLGTITGGLIGLLRAPRFGGADRPVEKQEETE